MTIGGAELARSEMFRSLADHSQEFVGMCDLEFKPFYVNAAGMRMVGLDSLEEACAVRVQDFFFPEDHRYVNEEFFPKVLREGAAEVEIRFRHFKTGEALWMIYNVFQVWDARGKVSGYATVSRDVTERKKADELVRSVALFPEENPFPVARVNTEGKLLFANRASAELLALWGCAVGERVPDAVHGAVRKALEAGSAQVLEIRLGSRRVSFVLMPISQRGYVNLYGRDVTEQKQAEEALRESREQFRLLYEKAPLGIARIDSHTGRFLLINAKYCEILQRSEAEALQLDFQTVTHPDDLALDLENMQRLREGLCRSFQMDKRYLRPDGSIIWVNLTVVPEWAEGQRATAHIAMVADITERKRAEEALARSEQLYRAIGESIDFGIWVCDAQGRNIYASDSFLRLTGITQEQCSEFGWGDILHPDDMEATMTAWKQCVQSGGPWYCEHRYRGADGQWHPILARGVAVRNERGEITHWAGINLDISLLKQTEGDLRKTRDQLAETNANLERLVKERTAKLQELVGELEHFSYSITHDMRAPLRGMQGFAEVMSESLQNGDMAEAENFLRRIRTSATRMDLLITDALQYAKAVRQELPLAPVRVGPLLRGIVDSYPEFQTDRARIEITRGIPQVMGNEAGLTQVFSNLLGNAVKFRKPGGRPEVRVWAEVLATGEHFKSELGNPVSDDEWVRIWVEDNGVGIPDSMKTKVFDMFARGHTSYEGTGIGLALVRKVAQRMGGRVGVESELGKGSRFWLDLRKARGDF